MNWLQKIATTIGTRNIPFQIHAALNNMTGKGWTFYKREKGYRDWTALVAVRMKSNG